jgi:DNA adenine methylase
MDNDSVNQSKARPFLKWAGGKAQLLPELLARVPGIYETYREPFLGGGALFWALRPQKAVLSDANLELVRTWRAVKDSVNKVVALLKEHEASHSKEQYLRLRSVDPEQLGSVEVAARMIYLNKTCFNGLYRVNRRGEFNVPMGRYGKSRVICDSANLRACSAALQGVAIECMDYSLAIRQAGRGDFVYCDPPYVPLSATASFTSYTADKFGSDDQKHLAELARAAKARGVHILLSNSFAHAALDLYDGFQVVMINARRHISCKSSEREDVKECLIS